MKAKVEVVDSSYLAGLSITEKILPDLWLKAFYQKKIVICKDLNGIDVIMIPSEPDYEEGEQ